MARKLQLRRDFAARWISRNPVLADGELGVERDTGMVKIGDGNTPWMLLGYWDPSGNGARTGADPTFVEMVTAQLASKATLADIASAIAALKGSATALFDTLGEIEAYINDDQAAGAAMLAALGFRVRVDEAQELSIGQQGRARANVLSAPIDASAMLGLCVNPFFEVSQENGTTLQSDVGSSGKYAADQWLSAESAATLVLSAQQVATPFSSTAGFKRLPYSVKAVATTAQASLGSSEVCTPCRQTVEGTFWKTLGWGGGDGVDAVVVGVIMPSVTGTYPVTIRNAAGTRSMVKTVSLTANTPTVIYETFSADTSGTWVTSTSASAIIEFGTTSGSTYETSTLGSWQSADYRSATTATDWQGTTNAFVQVAYLNVFPSGVLPWSSASEITGEALQRLLNMRRPFDEELRRCRRYFDSTYEYGTAIGTATDVGALFNSIEATVYYPHVGKKALDMRSTPAIAIYSALGVASKATVDGVDKNAASAAVSSRSASVFINNQLISANQFAYAHVVANARM